MFRPFQAANRHSGASETSPEAQAHLPPVQGSTFAVQVRSQIPVRIEDYPTFVLDGKFPFLAQELKEDKTLLSDLYKTEIILDDDLDN